MTSPVQTYQSEMHGNLGFFATWLPGDPIEIGDIGIFEAGRFRRMLSLKELGIKYKTEPAGSMLDVQYASTKGTTINAPIAANIKSIAKANITIDFSSAGAFVFHASKMQPHRLENRMAVADQILKIYQRKKWEKSWLLVEAIYTAKCATVIVAEESSAQLVLAAKGGDIVNSLSFSDPKVGLSIVSTRGKLFQMIGGKDLQPLYSCLRLEAPFFGKPSVQPVRGVGENASVLEFSRPSIDELLKS